MTTERPLTLAIEAAISGGGLSLFHDESEIESRYGVSNTARAEELLADIDGMLKTTGHQITEVGLITVSAGPGSFTGIRIGFSTALGLATGLGSDIASESALRAMANEHSGYSEIGVAVPMGRNTVCSQVFDTSNGVVELSEPRTQSEEVFIASIHNRAAAVSLLHEELFIKVGSGELKVINFGRNIASAIGRICIRGPRPQTEPIFISKIV